MNRGRNSSRLSRGFQAGKIPAKDLKQQCLKAGCLFEDPDFEAAPNNIFFSRQPPRPYIWKRPHVSVRQVIQGVLARARQSGKCTRGRLFFFFSYFFYWMFVLCACFQDFFENFNMRGFEVHRTENLFSGPEVDLI